VATWDVPEADAVCAYGIRVPALWSRWLRVDVKGMVRYEMVLDGIRIHDFIFGQEDEAYYSKTYFCVAMTLNSNFRYNS
jgi:hypothetical protein